jgi:hypothetical protein
LIGRSVAGHLKNPHYLVSMLMDKSFDPVIDADSEDFDIERASMRYVVTARAGRD